MLPLVPLIAEGIGAMVVPLLIEAFTKPEGPSPDDLQKIKGIVEAEAMKRATAGGIDLNTAREQVKAEMQPALEKGFTKEPGAMQSILTWAGGGIAGALGGRALGMKAARSGLMGAGQKMKMGTYDAMAEIAKNPQGLSSALPKGGVRPAAATAAAAPVAAAKPVAAAAAAPVAAAKMGAGPMENRAGGPTLQKALDPELDQLPSEGLGPMVNKAKPALDEDAAFAAAERAAIQGEPALPKAAQPVEDLFTDVAASSPIRPKAKPAAPPIDQQGIDFGAAPAAPRMAVSDDLLKQLEASADELSPIAAAKPPKLTKPTGPATPPVAQQGIDFGVVPGPMPAAAAAPAAASWSPSQLAAIKSEPLAALRKRPEFDRLTKDEFIALRGAVDTPAAGGMDWRSALG